MSLTRSIAVEPLQRLHALVAPAGAGYRFFSTFRRLLGHYAAIDGWRFWLMVAAVLAAGVCYPLPLLLLAATLRAAQGGAQDLTLPLLPTVTLDQAVSLVFASGILAILAHFAVARLVQMRTLAWQTSVFWQLMADLPRIARWDRPLSLGVTLAPAAVASRLLAAARAGFLIGRLIETGLRDSALALAALVVLLWLDAGAVIVIAFVSVLFVPVYALALSELVRGQARNLAEAARASRLVTAWLRSGYGTSSLEVVDPKRAGRLFDDTISNGVSNALPQISSLSAIGAVAGIHLFTALYAVFLADGGTLAEMPIGKITFFVVLLVGLRAMQGLIGLVSRISRGYDGLSLLRELLQPLPSAPIPSAPLPKMAFELSATSGSGWRLGAGDQILFLAPHFSHAFQLLPVALALKPHCATERVDPTIRLLGDTDLQRIATSAETTGSGGQRGLPCVLIPDLQNSIVIAMTAKTWTAYAQHPAVAAYLAERLAIIVVGPWQGAVAHAPWQNSDLPTVASDGRGLIGVGDFLSMLERCRAAVPAPGAAHQEDGEDIEPAGF